MLDEPAGLDDPPAGRLAPFPHDDVTIVGVFPATPTDDELDALRVEVPERLIRPQECRDPLGVRLLCERRRGLGVRAGEGDCNTAVEPQNAHGGRGGA